MEYYYSLLANPLKFNKIIKDKYDCVIACNHNAPSYFASYMNSTPKVVWIRGDMSELNYKEVNPTTVEYKGIKQEYTMQKNVLEKFDNIVVISDIVQKNLKEYFAIDDEKIFKIPNSVDVEKIKILSNEQIILPKKHIFTSLGRLDANKNQILLLKAAKIIKKNRKDFKVYLLGAGEEKVKLENYIKENSLEDYVVIEGFKDNPYPYIKKSDATVLTSLSEGFSLALVESAVLNTPIISTDVGIARELIEKYQCGTLIDYDENMLADIMSKYMLKIDNNLEKKSFDLSDEFDVKMELT